MEGLNTRHDFLNTKYLGPKFKYNCFQGNDFLVALLIPSKVVKKLAIPVVAEGWGGGSLVHGKLWKNR